MLSFLFSPGIQISLTELQSLLLELEGRNEGQAANIESLTATLTTKDQIIAVSNPIFTSPWKLIHLYPMSSEFLFCALCRFSTSALVRQETVKLIKANIRPLALAWRPQFLAFLREREP